MLTVYGKRFTFVDIQLKGLNNWTFGEIAESTLGFLALLCVSRTEKDLEAKMLSCQLLHTLESEPLVDATAESIVDNEENTVKVMKC